MCVFAHKFYRRKEGGPHHAHPPPPETNHCTEMEKCQIAISSSERDKDTFPKDTPCSKSESQKGRALTDQVLSLSSREAVTDIRSECPNQRDNSINRSESRPARLRH